MCDSLFRFLETLIKAVINDKILVILSATSIAIIALLVKAVSPEAKEIVVPVITGLMGVAVGIGVGRRSTDNSTNSTGGKK